MQFLFLTDTTFTTGEIRRSAKFVGRVGAELNVEAARKAAHLAALSALAVARQHLGSLDKVTGCLESEPGSYRFVGRISIDKRATG
jgi:hypothetical protein